MAAAGQEALGSVFVRFLSFGARAWGGPAAQLAMIRQEAVASGWVSGERFNGLLAVYQALPGAEATEMCVHLGLLLRGRLGAVVAGLGFVLPGLLLMLALSWAYIAFGLSDPAVLAHLAGFAPAVAALVAAACIRLGRHAMAGPPPVLVGLGAALATLAGLPFYAILPLAGMVMLGERAGKRAVALAACAVALSAWVAAVGVPFAAGPGAGTGQTGSGLGDGAAGETAGEASTASLGLSGLKAGLLTFGGAYTSIPFLQEDAVGSYATRQQFVDGIALAGTLPAPLIIFGTFLGAVGGGLAGALAMTLGLFAPAFAFTLLGHRHLERLSQHVRLASFLDGVTAGVIGLLAVTALQLLAATATTAVHLALAVAAFALLSTWKSRWAAPSVIVGAGALGAILHRAGAL